MWKTIGASMSRYRSYPRIVGETGGKDFIVAHASADPQALAVAIVRGGFEYQGQKCSAASRVYVPRSIWADVRDRAVAMMREIKMGDVADFRNFMGAVIDRRAFEKIGEYLAEARRSAKIVSGGNAQRREGLVHRADAGGDGRSRRIACCARRSSARWSPPTSTTTRSGRRRCASSTRPRPTRSRAPSSPRTGAPCARRPRRCATRPATSTSTTSRTGAVVGQQPFGGARASGTNDKAGSKLNLVRWVSARTIKETFSPPQDLHVPVHGGGVGSSGNSIGAVSSWRRLWPGRSVIRTTQRVRGPHVMARSRYRMALLRRASSASPFRRSGA